MKNFSALIKDFEKNFNEKKIRRLKDMKDRFSGKVINLDKIIYKVFVRKMGAVNIDLTVINSGRVGREFFMTKGHIHRGGNPEFFILLEGKGNLVLQNGRRKKIVRMKKGKFNLVPVKTAHRLVNVGKKELKVLSVYHPGSKPNYNVRFK